MRTDIHIRIRSGSIQIPIEDTIIKTVIVVTAEFSIFYLEILFTTLISSSVPIQCYQRTFEYRQNL